jgi:hypothetical protein
MEGEMVVDLGSDFVRIAREHLATPEVQARILYMADRYTGFEEWLNWELAYAFSLQYPWPDYTAQRAVSLPGGGRADLALFRGERPGERGPVVRVATTLAWDDTAAGRAFEKASMDEARIAAEGEGVLVVGTIGAGVEVEGGPRYGSAAELLLRAERALTPETRATREVVFDHAVKPGAEWSLAPRVLIAMYRVAG